MPIFETHAHFDDEQFDADRDELLKSMPAHGISPIVNVGASFDGAKKSLELAHAYPFVYAAVGIHPSEIGDFEKAEPASEMGGKSGCSATETARERSSANENSVLSWMRSSAADERTVAIGEIGLDYYWEKDPEIQERQQYYFARQLDIAEETGLPVIIHSRDACADTFAQMKDAARRGIRGVIHCFSYSPEVAEEYVKMGYYIGVGGVVTFKNAKKLKEIVAAIPLERILTETDSPYLAPEPFRGTRNDSTLLPYVVQAIAKIREITEDEVIEVTSANARRLFSFSR